MVDVTPLLLATSPYLYAFVPLLLWSSLCYARYLCLTLFPIRLPVPTDRLAGLVQIKVANCSGDPRDTVFADTTWDVYVYPLVIYALYFMLAFESRILVNLPVRRYWGWWSVVGDDFGTSAASDVVFIWSLKGEGV